jgi:predicted nucleotidyltransferase
MARATLGPATRDRRPCPPRMKTWQQPRPCAARPNTLARRHHRYTAAVDRTDLLTRLRALLAGHPAGISCAYLFGSVARGQDTTSSDIDVAVLFTEQPPPTPEEGLGLALAGIIEEAIGRPLDLVVLNTAPVDLVHRVLRDGILLLDADPSARIRFEIAARNAYFDLLPILRRYRRSASGAAAPAAQTRRPPNREGSAA